MRNPYLVHFLCSSCLQRSCRRHSSHPNSTSFWNQIVNFQNEKQNKRIWTYWTQCQKVYHHWLHGRIDVFAIFGHPLFCPIQIFEIVIDNHIFRILVEILLDYTPVHNHFAKLRRDLDDTNKWSFIEHRIQVHYFCPSWMRYDCLDSFNPLVFYSEIDECKTFIILF